MRGNEIEVFAPCNTEQKPNTKVGDRVFAIYRGEWEMVGGGASGIYVGNLTYGCAIGATKVNVTTSTRETIEVIIPYPNDVNASPQGHPCRYYTNGDEWVLFDMACVQ
jgi:hypothetical protein